MENTKLALYVPLADVTPAQVEQALAIDSANEQALSEFIKGGDKESLPGNWDAADKMGKDISNLQAFIKKAAMSTMMHMAEVRNPGPLHATLLRFMTLGYELGLIAANDGPRQRSLLVN